MKATEQYVSCAIVYNAVQGGSNFGHGDEILKCDHLNESYRTVLSCGTVYYVAQLLTFKSVDVILKCDHSNESY